MCFARCNYIISWSFSLHNHPHCSHIVAGKTPISLRVQIAEVELLGSAMQNGCDSSRDLTSDKRRPASGRFVIEKNAVNRKHPICFAIIPSDMVGVDLRA